MDAREYFTAKRRFWPDVCKAYDSLADEYELLCLEGAGSPGEINLKSADVVNMNMARYARARVLLAGDIDRGGVYASFLGTWMTFAPWEKELLAGFVVNKFRGDPDLLAPAHSYMRNRTGKPVLGVIPMMRDINIPEEDRATAAPLPRGARETCGLPGCGRSHARPRLQLHGLRPSGGGAGRPAPPGADTGGMGKSGPGHSARH